MTRIISRARIDFDTHAADCGDRVLAVALHPADFDDLMIAELWGVPVVAWEEISKGTMRLLCEAEGVLIPQLNTVEELLDQWTYRLQRPADGGEASAAA